MIVPHNFAVVKQVRGERFEWIAFKTHGSVVANQIVGRGSFYRGLPEDVIVNSYSSVSREEARMLKNNMREEVAIVRSMFG